MKTKYVWCIVCQAHVNAECSVSGSGDEVLKCPNCGRVCNQGYEPLHDEKPITLRVERKTVARRKGETTNLEQVEEWAAVAERGEKEIVRCSCSSEAVAVAAVATIVAALVSRQPAAPIV